MDSLVIRAHGDREYWDKVALLARLNRTTSAAMIKIAMDSTYGDLLSSLPPFLSGDHVADQQRSNIEAEADHA